MKTKGNALSTWQIAAEHAIGDAVLAIVSSHTHLDTIDVVCLDPSSLRNKGIDLQSTPRLTPVKELADQHINICNLTYRTLGILAEHIVQVIKEKKVLRYTKGNIKKLLNGAINLGRLEKDALCESLRNKL